MAKPTLTASTVGKENANAAFKRLGKTQDFIAGTSGTTRQLVSKFLNGLSVEQPKFIAICEALELKWQEIAELDECVVTDDGNQQDLKLLVKEVKQKIAADVTDRCGTMRVLDMTEPVDLDRIYTDVNILKDLTRLRWIDQELLKNCNNREHFDRFLVGTIKERVTGLIAVDEIQKLVVLGKPGAGKTTFMKYLAISCLGDKFHGELVPIFVTLKVYAETKGAPTLQEYIFAELQQRKVSRDVVERLLDEGKALILLDGLDEVKKEDDRRVKQDIDKFSRDWLRNRFAITCRIAAREYQFEKFTEVEVADFDDKQIATFVNNWFREKDPLKAELLMEKLRCNKPIKELARTPLLLALLCLVLDATDALPEKQSDLYKQGLNFLLMKIDKLRSIDRDVSQHFRGEQIYKNLSPEDKANMIGKIAFNRFVKGEYFFRQEDLQRQIKDYICNLPEASADSEALRLDSEVVLKAIEHHHGLLVERARNIYSFSHLTFQEYFTAREIERDRKLEMLVQNITDPRWKEVFYLTAEMLRRSDDFFRMMKSRIDEMLASDDKLQRFIIWAMQKAESIQTKYKPAAMRSFYAYIDSLTFTPTIKLLQTIFLARELDYYLDIDIGHPNDDDFDSIQDESVKSEESFVYNNNISILGLDITLARTIELAYSLFHAYDIVFYSGFMNAIVYDIDYQLFQSLNIDVSDDLLLKLLQNLKDMLPKHDIDDKDLYLWCQINIERWIDDLRQICIDHRNIGHNWQLTEEENKLLEQYYAAKLLLGECMNRSYVSKEVREEIESTMLLPVEAISN